MQLSLIDPRVHTAVTKAMHDDVNLSDAIGFMRDDFTEPMAWPFVEHLCDIEGRPAWAVDDAQRRYVVIGRIIFRPDEFAIMHESIRTAARECFGRLDAIGAAA
ncbi:MAG: hypothetical protein Q7T73_11965 [Beijerinckiaceae bacterium]|nr:hypothetical protein [Beijerinckiaceae bacterium]